MRSEPAKSLLLSTQRVLSKRTDCSPSFFATQNLLSDPWVSAIALLSLTAESATRVKTCYASLWADLLVWWGWLPPALIFLITGVRAISRVPQALATECVSREGPQPKSEQSWPSWELKLALSGNTFSSFSGIDQKIEELNKSGASPSYLCQHKKKNQTKKESTCINKRK